VPRRLHGAAELGVPEAQAVPGAVDLGIQARGFAEFVNSLVGLPTLVERVAEVEVRHRVAGVRAQHCPEVGLRLGEAILRCKQVGNAVRGPEESGFTRIAAL